MRGVGSLGVICGAASTGLSACLYFLDLGTTINALATYYYYQYKCPLVAQPTPPLLRHDPICRIIRSNPGLYTISTEFWACLITLLLAHPIYAFMFWTSLPARQHPLRLAYFMPLIHLYRLLQLLLHGFNLKALEELQKGQRKANSLYNALGVAMETFPQFALQALVAVRLGDNISGSADVRVQAHRIPATLVLSLVVSLVTGFFSSGMAASLLISVHVPISKRMCVAILVGCQTVALMVSKAMTAVVLAQLFNGISIPLLIYISIDITIAWIYIGFFYRSYHCDYHGNSMGFKIVHSFVLALFVRTISPIYMHVKEGKSSRSLLLGTLSHILIDLLRIAFVLLPPSHLKERESPCHSLNITKSNEQWNRYLTCKVFLGATFSSLLATIFITLLFIWLMKYESNARIMLETSSNTAIVYTRTTSSSNTTSSNKVSLRSIHQRSTLSLFELMLVIVTILCIQKGRTQCINKATAKKYT